MLDYTDNELRVIHETLKKRFANEIEIHLADCEIKPDASTKQVEDRPAVYWHANHCNFIVVKLNSSQFQGRYFYTAEDDSGEGLQQYTNIENCVIALLDSQAAQASRT